MQNNIVLRGRGSRKLVTRGLGPGPASGTWLIPKAGGRIIRHLHNAARENALRRLSDGIWPEPKKSDGSDGEYSDLWLLISRAPYIAAVLAGGGAEYDPAWMNPAITPHSGERVGELFADATDYNGFACLGMVITGATEDLQVTLRLTYRVVTGYCARYEGAADKWNTASSNGRPWKITPSAPQTVEYTGTLAHADGTVTWDLCPDSGAPVVDLWFVDTVELLFGASSDDQALTFAGWWSVPFDVNWQLHWWMDRLAHRYPDWFGARVSLDGGPNYLPHYFYTTDEERAEVGFKAFLEILSDPLSESTTIFTRLKYLSEWYSEWVVTQHALVPTWNQSAVDEAGKDGDGNSLPPLIWGDMDEGPGYAEGTVCFAWHVGSVFQPKIWAYYIEDGGVRGVDKTGGIRNVLEADPRAKLADDGIEIAHSGTGYCGEYVLTHGPEGTHLYTLQLDDGSVVTLGQFVDAELGWAAVAAIIGARVDVCRDSVGRAWLALCGDSAVTVESNLGSRNETWVGEGTVFSGSGYRNPSISLDDQGRCRVLVEKDGVRHWARAWPAGAGSVWTELTEATVGMDLSNPDHAFLWGETWVVGVVSGEVRLQCSSADDLSLGEVRPGVSYLKICDAPADGTNARVTVGDGRELLVIVEQGGTASRYKTRDLVNVIAA